MNPMPDIDGLFSINSFGVEQTYHLDQSVGSLLSVLQHEKYRSNKRWL